jgi:hypothetical protein
MWGVTADEPLQHATMQRRLMNNLNDVRDLEAILLPHQILIFRLRSALSIPLNNEA